MEWYQLTRDQKISNLRRLYIKNVKDEQACKLCLDTLPNLTDFQLDLLIDLLQKSMMDGHHEF